MNLIAPFTPLLVFLSVTGPAAGADSPQVRDVWPGSKAREWEIDPNRIGAVGFSAGGHLALAVATGSEIRTYEPIDDVDKVSCRPDFAVAVYPGYLVRKETGLLEEHIHIRARTPP